MEAQQVAATTAPEPQQRKHRYGSYGLMRWVLLAATGLGNAAYFFGIGYLGREAGDEGEVVLGLGVALAGALVLVWIFGRMLNWIAAQVTRERAERVPAAWMYPIDEASHKARLYVGLSVLAAIVGLLLGRAGV